MSDLRNQLLGEDRYSSGWHCLTPAAGYRGMIRDLAAGTTAFLDGQGPQAAPLADAAALGRAYGRALVVMGVSIREAVEGFLMVRCCVEELAQRDAGSAGRAASSAWARRERLDTLFDRVLFGLAEAYDEARSLPGRDRSNPASASPL